MSKSFCFKLLGVLFCLLAGLNSSAFEVDGINYSTKSTGAVVAAGTYSGDIVIPETVTYDSVTYNVVGIANMAFRNCTQLTSVVIPETVTSIGQYAFSGCSSLVSVNIPSGITAIKDRTFYGCESLLSIEIPSAVTSIGKSAFFGCESLTSLNIHAGINEIGEYAFDECKALTYIDVDPANEYFHSLNGVLFNADCTQLLLFPAKKALKQYNVPGTTTSIAPRAFNYVTALQSIYIPGSVKTVCNDAFRNSAIQTAVFDEGVETIGEYAFYYDLSLRTIYLPTTLTSIGASAFGETNMLKEVISPSDTAMVITTDVFLSKIRSRTSKPVVYVPQGAESNYQNSGWTLLYFQFSNPSTLEVGTEYKVDSLMYVPLDAEYNLKIGRVYTKMVHDVGLSPRVIIKGNLCTVTQIASSAIAYCNNITSVDVPGTITRLYDNAFYSCASLSEVTLNEGLTQLGSFTFGSCDLLTSIRIPASVTTISNKSFTKCANLKNIYVDENNTKFASNNGVLFSKDMTKLVTYPYDHGTSYTVPNGTVSIETNAFLSTPIKSIRLPESLTTINTMAFSEASELKSIVVPEGVTKLNNSTFLNCTSLESVELPSTLANLANDVFKGATQLSKIRLHATTPPVCTTTSTATGIGPFSVSQFANTQIVIPYGSLVDYVADPVWGKFVSINEDVLPGDVNDDGVVNTLDLTALVDYFIHPEDAVINTKNSDVNRDGEITPNDITELNDLLLTTNPAANN